MLLALTLYWLLSVYANDSLKNLAAEVIKIDVPIVLIQHLCRVLCEHQNDVSWANLAERTSYRALLISYTLKLPWVLTIRQPETAFSKTNTCSAAHFDEQAAGGSHLASINQRYLAREMCLDFATLCRQYNDYESMGRDDVESNLSGLHFDESTGGNEQNMSFQLTVEDGRRDFSQGGETIFDEGCWRRESHYAELLGRSLRSALIKMQELN